MAGVAIRPPPAPWRRARGHRQASAGRVRSASGKLQRVGGRRPGIARLAPAARFDQRRGARSDDERGGREPRGIGRGEIAKLGRRLAARVELLDEQFAMAADDGGGDFAFRLAPAASSASEDMPLSSAPHPIARPCAAAMATRMPVKLPGPTPTRIAVPSARPAFRRSSAPAARHGRGRSARRAGNAFARAVEQGGGAGSARRVECQDHGRDSGHMRLNAASPVTRLRRISTSGT